MYWSYSETGNFDKVKTLLSQPPSFFFLCTGHTADECQKKVEEEKSRRQSKNEKELSVIADESMIENHIPKGIREGQWIRHSVSDQQINENQARLSIDVQGAGFSISRDVLMYQTEPGWKIIAIVDPGDFEFYGRVKSNMQG